MCNVKLTKPLNPHAKEWKPSSTPPQPQDSSQLMMLPHQTPSPAVPPPHTTVMFTAPPPQYNLFPPLEVPCHQGFLPYDVCSQPFIHGGHDYLYIRRNEDTYEGKKVGTIPWVKIPTKSPPWTNEVPRKKFGSRRGFPPRLRRRVVTVEKRPSDVKLEWRVVVSDKVIGRPCLDEGSCLQSHSYTTVMMKNIPNQLRRDFILKFLDEQSKKHHLEYDFLYLPMDFRTKDNLGYAFVNFTTAIAASKFKKLMQDFKWENVNTDDGPITSKKICEITRARVQGKEALLKRFENSSFSCDSWDFLPVLLDPPRNGSNPNPDPPIIIGKLSQPA